LTEVFEILTGVLTQTVSGAVNDATTFGWAIALSKTKKNMLNQISRDRKNAENKGVILGGGFHKERIASELK
jgi:hypothetical protein